jgi:hypothetical protein
VPPDGRYRLAGLGRERVRIGRPGGEACDDPQPVGVHQRAQPGEQVGIQ